MVLHGLKHIFQKPTPDLSSSERTNQLRSKTIYSGTVNLSTELVKPGSSRYKTYNGPFEVVNENGNGSLVASASYSDLLDITKGKVLLNQLPLTDLTYPYYEKNFGNGEIYVGNYQQFDGSFFSGAGPTGCADSVLVYDLSTTGFTGPGSYTGNSIGNTGVTGTVDWNQDIFIDPKHCYYSDPCASSASYMKFVDINFKGPTGATGATGITGPSQYYAQQILNANQYSGFRFPMSNFTLTCAQQMQSQTDGPLFCPLESNFNVSNKTFGDSSFMLVTPQKRIFQKPTPDLSSSERTNQLRSKTIYSGTVNLSTELVKPGSSRYKTYNGPFEVVNENGNGSLVASASYSDLLDITKGKVLLNQLPLTDLTYPYYEKNFGNGEIYVGNYQQFDGSFFSGAGPTGCADSVLVYDLSTTGFTGPGSYTGNSIGNTGVTGTVDWNQDIFIDPKHCYYSDPCASSASYMKFVDINFKGPTGATGATGITGPSQYYAQQILNANQYSGFRFPMSNFTLTCAQQMQSQTDGPLFCPLEPPSLSNFNVSSKTFGDSSFTLVAPQSNSSGAFTYSSSNPSVAIISGPNLDMITIVGVGTSTITAFQAPFGIYSSGSISTPFVVNFSSFTATWEYTSNDTSYTDLSGNISIPYDTKTYTIRVKATNPVGATYTQSSTSATQVGDIAYLHLTGTGNYTGSVTSPTITIILIPNTLTVSSEFITTNSYNYLDSSGNPSTLQVGGYTVYKFFPITTTTGNVLTNTTFNSNIRYLIVGGGGSGGSGGSDPNNYYSGDGGDAGNLIDNSVNGIGASTSFALTVGGPGSSSIFSTYTANGGASGGYNNQAGGNGGSGAGGAGGAGNGFGGGGNGSGGNGGIGFLSDITGGASVYYAGGGGGCGGHTQHSFGSGGSGSNGGGGQGLSFPTGPSATNGADEFGGGGGGSHVPQTIGGSGVVILRFLSYPP